MQAPPKSRDMAEMVENLHERYGVIEGWLKATVEDLANSGMADRRWAAIARTHFEEGCMALQRALRDHPADDPNNYGKATPPAVRPLPPLPPLG